MSFYHVADAETAARIVATGFRDGEGNYMTEHIWRGVWLSNAPLTVNEGAFGDTILEVDLPEHIFSRHEWVEDGKPYREALIPAVIVNGYPRRIIGLLDDWDEP